MAGLDRDLEVVEAEALEQPDLLERGLDERLRLVALSDVREMLGQGAGVGTDSHRNAGFLAVHNMRRPLVFALELPRRHQRRKLNDFMLQAGFETDVAPQMCRARGDLRAVQQRAPRPADDAAALRDGVIDVLMLRRQLFFFADS